MIKLDCSLLNPSKRQGQSLVRSRLRNLLRFLILYRGWLKEVGAQQRKIVQALFAPRWWEFSAAIVEFISFHLVQFANKDERQTDAYKDLLLVSIAFLIQTFQSTAVLKSLQCTSILRLQLFLRAMLAALQYCVVNLPILSLRIFPPMSRLWPLSSS